jgi:hypothetical protein
MYDAVHDGDTPDVETLARFLHLRSLVRAARNPHTNWPFFVLTALGWLINRSWRQ